MANADLRFQGKHCIVTGGSRGIGKSVVDLLLANGAIVYVLARHLSLADFPEPADGKRLHFIRCDLSVADNIRDAVEAVEKHTRRLDVLINNAGVSENVSFDRLALEEWERVLRVNLTGMMLCCKYASPLFVEGANIVNVSSVRAEAPGTSVAYATSKAGVIGLTRALARFFSPRGIRVNSVLPGPTDTGLAQTWSPTKARELTVRTKLNRMASPREIAEVIVFVASDRCSYMTGSAIRVDGGFE